ncbi:hypothetical protein R1sor_018910 [Riccia sorocarpa]|uniref:Nucleoporin Nup133/Nup155-like N-terminal domain-containing protein n=1 Tax=Riccia sorocarpa TaxID=122646 RepID=A0ABD3IB36_9MARC
MFSPARGKLGKGKGAGLQSPASASPAVVPHPSPHKHSPVSLRGSASPLFPWSSGSPVNPRTSLSPEVLQKTSSDGKEPILVSNFPQELRNSFLERPALRTDPGIHGGMDGKSGLSWIIHGTTLHVWSHLNKRALQGCAVLTIPTHLPAQDGETADSVFSEDWLVSLVEWPAEEQNDVSFVKACKSAGVVMCHRRTLAVAYWPDVFKDGDTAVVTLGPGDHVEGTSAPVPEENQHTPRRLSSGWTGSSGGPGGELLNSLLTSVIPGGAAQACVAIVARSNGELWRYDCCPLGITRQQITREVAARPDVGLIAFNSSCARSMVWRFPADKPQQGMRQLLLLTAAELECWNIELGPAGKASRVWVFNILGNPETQKDLAGQKQVWLLDLQVDDSGNFFTVLLASFSKDRLNSSSFMQYSLLTFFDSNPPHGEVVRKAPLQVILPKARVEEEDVLYSMRLRIGGKPMGSAVILAGDGTATIAYHSGGNLKLYHFDLAWGAGKVLDASVVPALEEVETSWLVLTEKSGVWAVPERAVIVGGVEPPERSLSRKSSSREETGNDERQRELNYATNRSALDSLDNRVPRAAAQRPLHDEEAEAIVGRMFQQYLATGRVDSAHEKLERAGAFEREVEMNIFARTSRVIVDTLAKHWVAGGAGSAAVMAAVSSQLIEKQRRHQQYLNFLSISSCHEELQMKQRGAMHAIMEHGEKLAAMVQLRELHNVKAQARAPVSGTFTGSGLQENVEVSGALWDTVLLVGEKARRNNVMLMDREKSEVFYTRVSELEEFFACTQQHGTSIIGPEQPVRIQAERLCELAEAATSAIKAAIRYRDSQSSWYPSPEGLTPWYCQSTVRSGLWKVASLILDLKAEASVSVPSLVPKLVSWLEVVTDVLLDAYAGAITAKVEREEEYRGLQMEYWTRRDTLLSALQRHGKEVADASVQYVHDEGSAEQQRRSVLKKMYPSLIAIARRHAGYQTLYNICSDLKDMDQLRDLMRESMGFREGRFSHYVFNQLYETKKYSTLLQFGQEFQEELEAFLQDHVHLRWLHEIFMQQYSSACSTLNSLALTPSMPEGERSIKTLVKRPRVRNEIRERRRLLYLAKLSALAGGEMAGGEKVSKIDANISINEIQEVAHEKEVVSDDVLSPLQLIEAFLKSGDRDLVVRAFEVFAYAGDSFRSSNRSLLEAAWLHAADQDNWASMKDVSEEMGWSDEHYWLTLQASLLCQISARCYSKNASYYGSPFQDFLPLFESDRTEEDNPRILKSETAATSVEAILRQHKDFSDAGEAMLTALRIGVSSESFDEKEMELEPMLDS